MTKLTCKTRARAVAIGLFLADASPALAQQEPVEVPDRIRIEVTGTRIPRIDGESGLPLQTITREDLINGGVQTAQELLERISANQSFGGWNEAKGEGIGRVAGFTAASLRGLGYQRTLVLLNGRRLAPYALSGGASVDLSSIPVSALERVEILKDGASAVYGTDAVGGVVNFILRKDFQGVEINANYFATEQGGGNNGRINATVGVGYLPKDKYNLFVSVDHFKQDPLKASQRGSTKTGYLPWLGVDRTAPTSLPANITQPDGFRGTFNPTIPVTGATPSSCLLPFSFPTQTRPLQCRFDFPSTAETIPETEKTSVIARLTRQINPDHELLAEASWYSGKFIQRISPTPVFNVTTPFSILPPSSPYFPAAYIATLPGGRTDLPIELNYRTLELGPRTSQATVEQWRGIVGLQGAIKGWDYQLAAHYTANQEVGHFLSGWLHESSFGPLLTSGVINPFGLNSDAVLEQMRLTQITGKANDNWASNFGGDVKLVNNVYALPAGPLALALGLEGRRESLEQTNSEVVLSGDVLAGGGPVPSLPAAHRTVWSMFGELNIPVVKSLEVNLATRYDHYSEFGSTTNPKVTLRWQPRQQVLLRASLGTGFRAPTLSDLFQPPSVGGTGFGFDDPIRCPVTNSPNDCGEQSGTENQGRFGGNPSLQPEKSQQVNAGIVVEPVKGMSASFDYYRVKVRNVIETLPVDVIFADFAHWAPAYIVRKPPDARYPSLPGEIAYVVQYQTNVGELRTSGLDVDIRWRGGVTEIGQFSLALTGTYVVDYKHTGFESANVPLSVGTRGPDGAISRWRHYATINWTYGPWGATLTQTFQDGYSEPDFTTCDANFVCPGTRRVGSYSVWDLQGRYQAFNNTTLTLGIRNALNTTPPISNQFGGNNDFNAQVGIDPTYADPRGRMYYGAIRYAFK